MDRFRGWALIVALTGAGQANADILQPLDAAATARLVAKTINEIEPNREASFDSRMIGIGDRHVTLSVKVAGQLSMLAEVNDLHEQLRAAPNGKQREEILLAFVRVRLDQAYGLESGRLIRTIDMLGDFDTNNLLPVISNRYMKHRAELISAVQENFAGDLFVVWAEDRTTRLPQLVEKYGRSGAPLSTWLAQQIGLDKLDLRKLGRSNLKAGLAA